MFCRNNSKWGIAIIVIDSILLATGILLILIACIQYSNWWPLMTILVHFFAIGIPLLCGGCHNIGESHSFMDDTNTMDGAMVSWLFVGFFVVMGYAIPAILLRGGYIPQVGLLLTFAGGTIILISVLIFVRSVYFQKDDSRAYFV